MNKLAVKIDYFKPNGKWYTGHTYETEHKPLYKIWEEVRVNASAAGAPDHGVIHPLQFHIVINVPEHEHAHPHMIPAT